MLTGIVLLAFYSSYAQPTDTLKKPPGDFSLLFSLSNERDSSIRFVSLPSLTETELYKVLDIGKRGAYNYVISDDSSYYKVFARIPRKSLPVFDFTKQELIVRIACSYCMSLGMMDNGEPRHRQSCAYGAFWYVRNKKK
jgi:hypothetical protein